MINESTDRHHASVDNSPSRLTCMKYLDRPMTDHEAEKASTSQAGSTAKVPAWYRAVPRSVTFLHFPILDTKGYSSMS